MTTTAPAYRVVHACITAKGARGSHGIFYQGNVLSQWDTGDGGADSPDDVEIARLLVLGCIEPINP